MSRFGDGSSSKGRRVFCAALVASLVAAASALAATGDLTPKGCVDDNDSGADACTQTTDGLGGAVDVAISDDGKSVYVAAIGDDSIARFARNTTTGLLVPKGCVDDNDAVGEPCAQTVDGLDQVSAVDVSADGKSVYAAGEGDQAIVRFNRNTTTGALTPAGCIDDNDTGPEPCAQSTDALSDVRDVTVSPDGLSVYAVGGVQANAIVRFDRDLATGALTPRNCIEDNNPLIATDDCTLQQSGLEVPQAVTVSPDNKSVYVASAGDDAIARFARNTTTGVLLRRGCLEDNDSGDGDCAQSADGLSGVFAVALSADSTSLYSASLSDAAVARFVRNTSTGGLSPRGCVEDIDIVGDACVDTAEGLEGAQDLVVSADGLSLYVAAGTDNAMAIFNRNVTNGKLTSPRCIEDGNGIDPGPECAQTSLGLFGTSGVVVSSDGLSVYTSSVDDAVARFEREP